jgi:DNA-binding transcriptional LysR family regulator
MVKALEQEVGAPLITRDKRCVELTDAGRLVFASGIEMLPVERQLRDALTDLGSGASGAVRVGVPPLAGPLVAPLVAAFRARCPDITLHFCEHGSTTLEAMLRDGTIDVGFVHPAVATEGLVCAPVSSDRLCLVAPRASTFAGVRGMPLAALATESFVLYDESCGLDDAIFTSCAEAGFDPAVAARATIGTRSRCSSKPA